MATRLHVLTSSGWVPAKEVLVYNGSSWTPKREAYVLTSSGWIPIIEYIAWYYQAGVEHVPWVRGYWYGGSYQKQSGALYLDTGEVWGKAFGEIALVTDFPVDLSGFSTLYVDWASTMTHTSGGNREASFNVSTSKTTNRNTYNVRLLRTASFARQVQAINVSGLSGSYYLRVHAYARAISTPGAQDEMSRTQVYVYNVYAE